MCINEGYGDGDDDDNGDDDDDDDDDDDERQYVRASYSTCQDYNALSHIKQIAVGHNKIWRNYAGNLHVHVLISQCVLEKVSIVLLVFILF